MRFAPGPGAAALAAITLFAAGAAGSADLPDVVARVKASVVAVGLYKATNNPSFTLRGTGFAVGDGLTIATNAHVVAPAPDHDPGAVLAIQIRSGAQPRVRVARLQASAPEHDLALLRIDDAPLPPLPLRDSSTVREGAAVAFTGYPIGNLLGFAPVTHRGIVSSITPIVLPGNSARQLDERQVRRLRAGTFDIFQLDATAYPGNSGSPVFDAASGEVIGVVNMVLVRRTREAALSQPSGFTYAIPANFLAELLLISR
ncbi:MAG: trypsin-like peptidase domain-containing protein [Burkholderiales bacterium]|nr:trypsin-like peptidase domain-containing protein [Burkholderiales bacterium]